MIIKRNSLFFVLFLFFLTPSFCSAQESAEPTQECEQLDTIEQHKPKTKSFTITTNQTGAPSLKTFYKTPVEIKITNNTDQPFLMKPPYFTNVSIWNADNIKIAWRIIALQETATAIWVLAIIGVPKVSEWATRRDWGRSDHDQASLSFDGGKFFLKLGVAVGLASQLAILANSMKFKCAYRLKPHETQTIKGYINKADIKNIQDIQLTPGVATSANN